jgi:hypothetical protein
VWAGSDFGAQGCPDDPTSIVIRSTSHLEAECLSARVQDCPFTKQRLQEIKQLDFDFTESDCGNTWAAPLWLNPEHWTAGPNNRNGDAGEMDFLENCPRNTNGIYSNWAYGAKQTNWGDVSGFTTEAFSGHATVYFENGRISVEVCKRNAGEKGTPCPLTSNAAVYPSCPSGMQGKDGFQPEGGMNGAGCFGNAENPGTFWKSKAGEMGSTFHLISDIWNGHTGDSGYQGCMGCDPNVGCPKKNNSCATSVEKIQVTWNQGAQSQFTGNCSALNAQ